VQKCTTGKVYIYAAIKNPKKIDEKYTKRSEKFI
jgi:hypothetical protein